MAKATHVYVKSNRDDARVALSEVDDAHPGGSAFVAAGTGPVKVGLTPFVRDQLREGNLVEVDAAADKKKADKAADEKMGEGERAAAVEANPDAEPMESMSTAKLVGIAQSLGVNVRPGTPKGDLITAINEKRAAGITPTPVTANPENVEPVEPEE